MLDLEAILSAFSQHLSCMGTCFGMLTEKSTVPVPVVENHDKHTDGRRPLPLMEKDLWSSSSNEVDNLGKNSRSSQRSLSSLSTTNQPHETQGTITDTGINVPFVNHGLLMWEEQRRQWTANHRVSRLSPPSHPQKRPVIRMNSTYEDLLSSSRPFVNPIPLSEMTSFLVNIWQQEGLYG